MKETIHIIVSGRVQGVGYRCFSRQIAHRLGITGTVENLDSGDVEIYAFAEQEILEEFCQKLKQGPSYGLVTELTVVKLEHQGDYKDFEIVLSPHYRW